MWNRRKAFSLVELSIVLVILGLLTGGVLAGQSLIRASELRSITTDFNRYSTAIFSFRDKYAAIPGDMVNATQFWGSAGGSGSGVDNTYTCNTAQTASSAATCNGDGDGAVLGSVLFFYMPEVAQFWKHLANAGLVEGSYTGKGNAGVRYISATIGTNVPQSKIKNGFFIAHNIDTDYYTGTMFTESGTSIPLVLGFFGAQTANPGITGILKPEDAWNIDKKMDDGNPVYGRMISQTQSSTIGGGNCTTADTAPAAYNLTLTTSVCTLDWKVQ